MRGRISTENPTSVLSNNAGPRYSPSNTALESFDRQSAIQQKQVDDVKDRDIEMLDKMVRNPQAAPAIAQMYGKSLTPEMQQMIGNPQVSGLAIEGAKMAKNMGFRNPEASKRFTSAYVQSGGDFAKATAAIEGIDASLGSAQTALRQPSSAGLPKGYTWGVDEVGNRKAMPIDGIDPSMYGADPWDDPRIPLGQRLEMEATMKNYMPGVTDPKELQRITASVSPYLGNQPQAHSAPSSGMIDSTVQNNPAPGSLLPKAKQGQSLAEASAIDEAIPIGGNIAPPVAIQSAPGKTEDDYLKMFLR